MCYRTSMRILLRFQDTLPEWVFISSADRAEQTDSVLLSFLGSQWYVHQNTWEVFLYC